MCYVDYRSAEEIMHLRAEEARHHAQLRELRRQVEGNQQGWPARQGCWLLYQLGHRLVVVGQRLERYGLPQPSF